MGWGTRYKHTGYLSRISKSQIWSKKDEIERRLDLCWREILAYMAATPPEIAKDCAGAEYPYVEFIAAKVAELREDMEEDYSLLTQIKDCIEAEEENPENITEC